MNKFHSSMVVLILALFTGLFIACEEDDNDNDLGLTSTCDVSNSLEDKYKEDAIRLALRQQTAGTGPASDQILIPPALIDRMVAALAAVDNSEYSYRDTVVSIYEIHTLDYPDFYTLTLEVDTAEAWVKEWAEGSRLTGNADVDALMNTYGLDVGNFITLSLGSVAVVSSTDPLNMVGLGNAFSSIPGVVSADAGGEVGDGNDITVVDNGTYIELTYSVGYDSPLAPGDCTGECDYRRYWAFQVSDATCAVDFVDRYGDPAP